MKSRRALALITAVAATSTGLVPGIVTTSVAAVSGSEPTYSYRDAIRETAYVQSPVDGDRDGKLDRIAADIIRPAESAAGLKVPVIMVPSPYYARPKAKAAGADRFRPAVDDVYKDAVDDGTPAKFPYWYDNYFVPRGYAVVLVDMPGSRASEGCLTAGGPDEVLGTKAVVDWIGGRATAVDKAGTAVRADWSTGNVAMTGASWEGTVTTAVATYDVPNLKTIVPTSAISSWYDYHRVGGQYRFADDSRALAADIGKDRLVDPGECKQVWDEMSERTEDKTGNYTDYWAERNIAKDAWKIKASVFLVHGLNDWNVHTDHTTRLWQQLTLDNKPRKLWLHQAAHETPFNERQAEYVETLHKWFDHWLLGIDNGIMDEPAVDLEQTPGQWTTATAWPAPDAVPTQLWFDRAAVIGGPGRLTTTPPGSSDGSIEQTFTDSLEQDEDGMIANPEQQKANRLVYLGEPLTQDTRLSGVPVVNLKASVSDAKGPLTALVVDYGTGERVKHQSGVDTGLVKTGERCIGSGDSVDTGCVPVYKLDTHVTPAEVVTEGWLTTRHRQSFKYESPVVPGTTYDFQLRLQPEDYVFKAGHRIGIVIAATDCSQMIDPCYGPTPPWPPANVTLKVRLSSVTLPTISLS